MARETTIEPEFEPGDESDEDALRRIQESKTDSTKEVPKPQSSDVVEEDQVIPPGTAPFNPQARNTKKQAEREQAKANREANRRRREEVAERRQLANRQQEEALRAQKQAAKDLRQESKDQITQTRSEAIQSRIQAYSLASSLGFPGYVAASLIDQIYLRPREERKVEAEKQYQTDLRKYEEGIRQDAATKKRRTEEMLKNLPVQATPIDKDTGKPIPMSNMGGGGEPPINANVVDNEPKRLPPRRPPPEIPSELAAMAGPLGQAAIAIIQTANFANQLGTSFGNTVSSIGGSIASGNAVQGVQASISGTKLLTAGANIPAHVVVEGFNSLLSINESILSSIQGTMAFSPQTMQASIERELTNFASQIENAQRLDKVTEQLVRANTQLDQAWQELRAEFIEDIGPAIVVVLNVISNQVRGAARILDLLFDNVALLPVALQAIILPLKLMADLAERAQAKEMDANDISGQIQDFFNVPLTVGKSPRGAMPPNI